MFGDESIIVDELLVWFSAKAITKEKYQPIYKYVFRIEIFSSWRFVIIKDIKILLRYSFSWNFINLWTIFKNRHRRS